jgi:hypothetical protein
MLLVVRACIRGNWKTVSVCASGVLEVCKVRTTELFVEAQNYYGAQERLVMARSVFIETVN